MKEHFVKKESPFEQGQGMEVQSQSRAKTVSPRDLSEMMNPSHVNFFGCGPNDPNVF